MGSNPVVFDISSDEEEVASALEESKGDDCDWFPEVLKAVNKGFGDSDEVMVVGEVNPNKKSKSQNSSVRKNVNVEDDDCIVLEGDLEKVVSDVNDNHEDSDELLIVGQKGQVACRDFPHPRHESLKLPWEIGLCSVVVEIDCKEAFDLLQQCDVMNGDSRMVPNLIEFLTRCWQVRLSYVLREGNKVSDSMAKLSWTLPYRMHQFGYPLLMLLFLSMKIWLLLCRDGRA